MCQIDVVSYSLDNESIKRSSEVLLPTRDCTTTLISSYLRTQYQYALLPAFACLTDEGGGQGRNENELEKSLINNLQQFLLELGKGFAFVARQKHIRTETQMKSWQKLTPNHSKLKNSKPYETILIGLSPYSRCFLF